MKKDVTYDPRSRNRYSCRKCRTIVKKARLDSHSNLHEQQQRRERKAPPQDKPAQTIGNKKKFRII